MIIIIGLFYLLIIRSNNLYLKPLYLLLTSVIVVLFMYFAGKEK